MIVNLLALAAGLVVLVFAADHFVLGASRVAAVLDIPRVVVGAVVIGFGTSLPEMVVSIIAAGGGDRDLGVGNIVGSNVANVGLVLGVAALITRMSIKASTLRREIPLSLAGTALFAVLYFDGRVERWEGAVLVVALVAAVVFLIRAGLAEHEEEDGVDVNKKIESLRTFGGLIGVVVGAQLVVIGATGTAEVWGVTGGFVGFSVVALGTSLPELVTTFVSARRGETELIIGNLFGSNLFNSLAVGGGMGLVGPGLIGDDRLTTLGNGLMLVVCASAFLLALIGRFVGHREGIVLISMYLVAMVVLGTGAANDDTASAPLEAVKRSGLEAVPYRASAASGLMLAEHQSGLML
ncbi:MAG: cation:H+ antiporter [Candidatus Aldehydirespiratoraceae bacterium]|jgi:cation:H+ antiporter